MLDKLGNAPQASIPVACEGWSETKAAYRFFDNPNVSDEKILLAHKAATLKRMQPHKTALLI